MRGILQFRRARRVENYKGGVVEQSIIDREMPRHAPGILCVKSEALQILRKTSVACGHRGTGDSRRRIRLRRTTGTEEKLGRIRGVEAGVVRISQHRFRSARKRTTQYWLVNKIYAEAWRVSSRRMAYVIAQLVFLLVAQHRKGGNRRRKLVVAKSVQPRNGSKGRAEGKLQRKSHVVVTSFGAVQSAGAT